MAKMRHMYGTKVPNFIDLHVWLTHIELLNLIGSYPPNLEMKINRRLREHSLRARHLYVSPPLTQALHLHLMAWLTAHALRRFPMRQWRWVLFTDGSQFTLFRPDGRLLRCGECFTEPCIVEWDRFGGGSFMVWEGIAHGVKSQLIGIWQQWINEWNNIPMQTVNAVVNSIQRRIRAALRRQEGIILPTDYWGWFSFQNWGGGGGGGQLPTKFNNSICGIINQWNLELCSIHVPHFGHGNTFNNNL